MPVARLPDGQPGLWAVFVITGYWLVGASDLLFLTWKANVAAHPVARRAASKMASGSSSNSPISHPFNPSVGQAGYTGPWVNVMDPSNVKEWEISGFRGSARRSAKASSTE